ncbi:unnamed protein product [Heligmosomoides polygyrus]|uniref:SH2 domain-containing protein n=1 Tax=Heligmosomoides polygyrus TaxID=6339 RepID=A0A183GL73_HELPZ|nr:unnamed protein product [Heligmosomoides polygyrus]
MPPGLDIEEIPPCFNVGNTTVIKHVLRLFLRFQFDKTLLDQRYYHGLLPREDVLYLLQKDGDFLVRITEGICSRTAIIEYTQTIIEQHKLAGTSPRAAHSALWGPRPQANHSRVASIGK